MRIVVASGKGGTGKTTLAVNLAVALRGYAAVGLLDCDVEEPNCHLFLKPPFAAAQPVNAVVPLIDRSACTGCGLCARLCEFNALLALPDAPLLLPELCHACGVCAYVCPNRAISETERTVGQLGAGEVDGLYFRWAVLNVGEARATPVIQAVKDLATAPRLDIVILDAPPGTACPAVETMRGADYLVLVTEPTPFGLYDLKLAVEAARTLNLPFGVVINRADSVDSRISDFCEQEQIDVLLEIPNDRRIAEACARGEIYSTRDPEFAAELRAFVARLQALVAQRKDAAEVRLA